MYGDEMNFYEEPQREPRYQMPEIKPVGNGLGIASLVLGIVSLVLFCTCVNIITGVLAIIFGIVQLNKGGNRGMPIAGIVTSALSIAACVIYWIAMFGTAASYADIYSNPSYYYEEFYNNMEYDLDSNNLDELDYEGYISL